jgi:hypothetical protein
MCKDCLKKDLNLNCIRITDLSNQIDEILSDISSSSSFYQKEKEVEMKDKIALLKRITNDIRLEVNFMNNKIDQSQFIKNK